MSSLQPRRGGHGDMDFADVFGGPPRRASMHELRRRGGGASSLDLPACARSNSSEKPVFGENRIRSGSGGGGGSMDRRRRELGDDFFSDIFPGSESLCSTPRQAVVVAAAERDVFAAATASSLSGSRVISPNRPMSSSFSMKFAKGMDHPAFGSPSQHSLHNDDDLSSYAYSLPSSPKSSMSSVPIRAVPSQDDLRKSPLSLYRRTSFSRLRSNSVDRKEATHYVGSLEKDYQRTQTSLEGYIHINQFHFSFYKWASKGVSLVLPTTPEVESKIVRNFPEVVVHGVDLIDDEDNISTTTGAFRSRIDSEDQKLAKDNLYEREYNTDFTSIEGLHTPLDKTPSKNLHELLNMDVEEQGMDNVTNEQVDTQSPQVPVVSPSIQDSRAWQQEKVRGSRVKGKVKEFIKIFNPEGSPKHRGTFNTQESMSSVKNKSKSTAHYHGSTSGSDRTGDTDGVQLNNENAFIDASSPMNEGHQKMEKSDFNINSNMNTLTDAFFERKETIEPFTDPTSDVFNAKMEDAIDPEQSHVDDIEGCLIEHLSEDQCQVLLNDEEKDQIKISESKIREWSKGKEGNIRALLSTLQNVLWPESGWKTVRLVDIIEGAAVKRAYQKTLLCLHPDKLQQRGAAMHQKYIAEKVFDILKEAWTEFNTITFG